MIEREVVQDLRTPGEEPPSLSGVIDLKKGATIAFPATQRGSFRDRP